MYCKENILLLNYKENTDFADTDTDTDFIYIDEPT